MIPGAPLPEEAQSVRPGEAFLQWGCRIVVIEVDEFNVRYCLPQTDPGKLRTVPREEFDTQLALGLVERLA